MGLFYFYFDNHEANRFAVPDWEDKYKLIQKYELGKK